MHTEHRQAQARTQAYTHARTHARTHSTARHHRHRTPAPHRTPMRANSCACRAHSLRLVHACARVRVRAPPARGWQCAHGRHWAGPSARCAERCFFFASRNMPTATCPMHLTVRLRRDLSDDSPPIRSILTRRRSPSGSQSVSFTQLSSEVMRCNAYTRETVLQAAEARYTTWADMA